MNKKEIVVTGATGHIGNRLVQELIKRGYKVTALVRKESKVSNYLKIKGAEIKLCDLNNVTTFSEYLYQKNALFHLAAENSTDTTDKEKLIKNTLDITKTVINAALKQKVKQIIYTSSVVVLGRSKNQKKLVTLNDMVENSSLPYVEGKIYAEKWIREKVNSYTDIKIIYPSWVVGPGDYKGTPPNKFLIELANKNNLFTIKGGVSLAHVDDVVDGHILAMEKGLRNDRFILSGHNLTFSQIQKKISLKFDKSGPIFSLPNRPLKKLIHLLGKFSPLDPKYAEEIIGTYSWYDNHETITKLGYKCKNLEEIFDDIKILIKQEELNVKHLNLTVKRKYHVKEDHPNLLITGYPGWLGNRIIEKLCQENDQTNNVGFKKIKLLIQERYIPYLPKLSENFEIIPGDLSSNESLLKATEDIDVVWHLAGTVYPKKRKDHYAVNFLGTKNLANACIQNRVKRFHFMSTDSVCGFETKNKFFSINQPYKPYKDYGKSKYQAEKLLKSYHSKNLLKVTILRGFWFFGPNMPIRNKKFFQSFFWRYQILFGNGQNIRSITHLDDIFYSLIELEKSQEKIGKIYWITSLKEQKSVLEIYELIADAFNTKLNLIYIPNIICEFFSILDKVYTKITGNINPTLLAAGKFHKNIAFNRKSLHEKNNSLILESKITAENLKEEFKNEFLI